MTAPRPTAPSSTAPGSTAPSSDSPERWLTFEIAGGLYVVPIADVLEVADAAEVAAVPTLPLEVGGVMNHHGDALPVVSPAAFVALEAESPPKAQHILVISDSSRKNAYLGLPVDSVVGLADGENVPMPGTELIAARRPIDGRIASIIDMGRLRSLAAEVIATAVEASAEIRPEIGGEI